MKAFPIIGTQQAPKAGSSFNSVYPDRYVVSNVVPQYPVPKQAPQYQNVNFGAVTQVGTNWGLWGNPDRVFQSPPARGIQDLRDNTMYVFSSFNIYPDRYTVPFTQPPSVKFVVQYPQNYPSVLPSTGVKLDMWFKEFVYNVAQVKPIMADSSFIQLVTTAFNLYPDRYTAPETRTSKTIPVQQIQHGQFAQLPSFVVNLDMWRVGDVIPTRLQTPPGQDAREQRNPVWPIPSVVASQAKLLYDFRRDRMYLQISNPSSGPGLILQLN